MHDTCLKGIGRGNDILKNNNNNNNNKLKQVPRRILCTKCVQEALLSLKICIIYLFDFYIHLKSKARNYIFIS
jgi:hypothetical protein